VTERIVGFLDVLGFSDQVKSQSQAELAELYRRLIKGAYEHSTVTVVPDDWRKWQGGEAYFEEWEETTRRFVHVMMASDSIVVFSDGADRDGVGRVVGSAYRLFREAVRLGMPLRGAISLGELDVVEVKDVAEPGDWTATVGGLVGLGLVRAHELERQFEWSGVVLDPAVVDVVVTDMRKYFDGGPEVDALITPQIVPFLTEAVAPHKNRSERRSLWVVDWTAAVDDGLPGRDGLRWPRRGGLKWPHLASVVVCS
jgi:hypothetical protein